MNQIFYDAVGNNPIIAAVKNMKDIEVSCTTEEIQVIFILFGDVCSIDRIVKRVKDAGKVAMVHVDLISGLSPKEVSVEYLKEHTEADGIISTKPSTNFLAQFKKTAVWRIPCFALLQSINCFLTNMPGSISGRFHFDELQNNKRIRNQESICPDFEKKID